MSDLRNLPLRVHQAMDVEISRRAMLKRTAYFGVAVPTAISLLAACGGDDDDAAETSASGSGGTTATTAPAGGSTAAAATSVNEGSAQTSETEARYGGTLRIGLSVQPSTHNPYGGVSGTRTLVQFLESVVTFDKETMEIRPQLAHTWEIENDTRYVFQLREGVKFHDGTDFNADAVKFAFDYMLNPDNASPRIDDFSSVESIEVISDHEVAFNLKEPFSVLLATLAYQGFFVSPKFLEEATKEQLNDTPVGTGPFAVKEWVKDDRIVMEKFADYWEGKFPYLDELLYRIIPDSSVRATALRAGEVDLIDTVAPEDVAGFKSDPNFVFASAPSAGYRSIYLNCAAPPFDDMRVRQALSWAVDREQFIELGALGFGTPAYGPISPALWAYDPDFKPYEQDPDKARALLAEAGLADKLSFAVKVSNRPDEVRMLEVLQAQFAEIGVEMLIDAGEYNTKRSEVIAGNYEGFFVGFTGGADPDRLMYNSFHSEGWFNWVNYENAEVDKLLTEARQITDQAERTELYQRAQEIIAEESPHVFLRFPYYPVDGQVHSVRVQNYAPDPLGSIYFREVWLQES